MKMVIFISPILMQTWDLVKLCLFGQTSLEVKLKLVFFPLGT